MCILYVEHIEHIDSPNKSNMNQYVCRHMTGSGYPPVEIKLKTWKFNEKEY